MLVLSRLSNGADPFRGRMDALKTVDLPVLVGMENARSDAVTSPEV